MVVSFTEGWSKAGKLNGKRQFREPGRVIHNNIEDVFSLSGQLLYVIFRETLMVLVCFFRRLFASPKSLRGKVCFVTGSGRGLGRGLCLALAKEGAIIACADIDETNNRNTLAMLEALGARAKAYTLNVALKKDVDKTIALAEKDLGPIYLLVNNAAIVMPMWNSKEEFVRASFNVNALGCIWAIETVLPKMKSRNEGHILNIGSISSMYGLCPVKTYGATKAAIANYSRALRCELILNNPNNNIHITSIHSPVINTSEDYIQLPSSRIHLVMEIEEAVEEVVNSIKYNKEEVWSKPLLGTFFQMSHFLPARVYANIFNILVNGVEYPTEEEYYDLPAGDLVKSCAFIGDPNISI